MDKIEDECPECGSVMAFGLSDIAAQRTVRCRKGHKVKLMDEGGGVRKAQKALADLEKKFKKLGD